MAELIASEREQGGKISATKKLIRVDMTPMVDLGFLLITFFMFTTNFSKPNVVDLGLPAGKNGTEIDYRNQLTFVLGKDNRIFYYQKELKYLTSTDVKEISPTSLNVAKLINSYKKVAPKPQFFTIIIKPTDEANYKNFVDMLDEMAISHNEQYGIAELKPAEEIIYKEKIR